MQKKIVKASPAAFGHLMFEFEDGTKQMATTKRTSRSPATCGPRMVMSM